VVDGTVVDREAAALSTLNERLRDDYIAEVQAGVDRWNRHIARAGLPFSLTLPHKAFHRAIGNFAGHHVSPTGEVLTKEEWHARRNRWLPTEKDYAFVQSLMSGRVVELGKFANWIAPPRTGINSRPLDFEYVRFN
jgi:benzoyl-CoA 2,3-dioxygenase component B